jgi:hypothetical protein
VIGRSAGFSFAAIGFFVTFAVTRAVAYGAYRNVAPFHYVHIRSEHIHHLVWAFFFCWQWDFAG